MIKKLAIVAAIVAIAAKMFRTGPDESCAFDKTFPNNGYTWKFEVILNEDSTALAEKEAELLDKLDMSPMFRCGNGLFGEAWLTQGVSTLLRIYKLVLEDVSPPDENKFLIRHQILGKKLSKSQRFDEFTCTNPKKGNVCTEWHSVGYVSPRFTKLLTKGATDNPYYEQKLTLVPKSDKVAKSCPLVKEAWWCLWVFCPMAKLP